MACWWQRQSLINKFSTSDKYIVTKGYGITPGLGIGYFPADHLAAGVKVYFGYDHTKGTYNNGTEAFKQTTLHFQLGSFVRYYFMPAQYKMNLLADASYFAGWTHTDYLASSRSRLVSQPGCSFRANTQLQP